MFGKPQGPFKRSPTAKLRGNFWATTQIPNNSKKKPSKKHSKKHSKKQHIKKRLKPDIARRRTTKPLTRVSSRRLKRSQKTASYPPNFISISRNASPTSSLGNNIDYSLLAEAFSAESKLWIEFKNNALPSPIEERKQQEQQPTNQSSAPSFNTSNTSNTSTSPTSPTSLNPLLAFSVNDESKRLQSTHHAAATPLGNTIPFVNIQQYLYDVRNYMTRALSGQMVETPYSSMSSSTVAPNVSTQTTKVNAHSSVGTFVTENHLELFNATTDRSISVTSPSAPSGTSSISESSISTRIPPHTLIDTKSIQTTSVQPLLTSTSSASTQDTNNINTNNINNANNKTTSQNQFVHAVSLPIPSSKTKSNSNSNRSESTKSSRIDVHHKHLSSTRVVGSKIDDHMDNATMKMTKAHGIDYVHENKSKSTTTTTKDTTKKKKKKKSTAAPADFAATSASTVAIPKRRRSLHEPKKRANLTKTTSSTSTSSTSSTSTTRFTNRPIVKSKIKRVIGSKVDDQMNHATMKLTKAHEINYIHNKNKSGRSMIPTKITTTITATTDTKKKSPKKTSKKTSRRPKTSKKILPQVSNSWGRLLSTALGLTNSAEKEKQVQKEIEKPIEKINDGNKKKHTVFAKGNTTKTKKSKQIPIQSKPITPVITTTKTTFGSEFESRELFPREFIVMKHLLCFEQVKTHKQLPIVQRIVDGLAGFLLRDPSPIKTTGKGMPKKLVRKSSKRITTTMKRKKKKKSPSELFESNVAKIESIFLQLPVTIDGIPSHAAENDGKGCPHFIDVGVKMKTIIKMKTKSKRNSPKNSNTVPPPTTKPGKGKTFLATPILMPIKRSGKCLIPSVEKCVFDFTSPEDDPSFASSGMHVVRFFLTKDIVADIIQSLAMYATMYNSNGDKEIGQNVEGNVNGNQQRDEVLVLVPPMTTKNK